MLIIKSSESSGIYTLANIFHFATFIRAKKTKIVPARIIPAEKPTIPENFPP